MIKGGNDSYATKIDPSANGVWPGNRSGSKPLETGLVPVPVPTYETGLAAVRDRWDQWGPAT